jgi:hypothetical protein|uniref:Uncharacterized protein n=1 Tax=Podoviridae sp. ctdDI2 TaxID=2826567 RepID=A0A8S5NPR9_9CAUD|nr:MAG TPA: hypothetical protein [Podoviridae sp. ctdDI2]DAS72706.1 MAG TPA: hypothetical protein [Caudoviricetes sp.]DAX25861.1 MAG TPA: hypothetical protein [Caudoviricetes sp.]
MTFLKTFIEYVRVIVAFPFAVAAFLAYGVMITLAIVAVLIGGEPYEQAVADVKETL